MLSDDGGNPLAEVGLALSMAFFSLMILMLVAILNSSPNKQRVKMGKDGNQQATAGRNRAHKVRDLTGRVPHGRIGAWACQAATRRPRRRTRVRAPWTAASVDSTRPRSLLLVAEGKYWSVDEKRRVRPSCPREGLRWLSIVVEG